MRISHLPPLLLLTACVPEVEQDPTLANDIATLKSDLATLRADMDAELLARDTTIANLNNEIVTLQSTVAYLSSELDACVDETEMDAYVAGWSYVDETELSEALGGYVTGESLATTLDGYTTDAELTALGYTVSELDGAVSELDIRVTDTETRITDLETNTAGASDLLAYVSADPATNSVTFSGANVYVQSGEGSTLATVNGLGNLIVGYDEDSGSNTKSGSHNFVVGAYHTYTGDSSLVTGYSNAVLGNSAAVIGGVDNQATTNYAVVTGGYRNQATETYTTVAGGQLNYATISYASVFGGYGNEAGGSHAVVVGGSSNDVTAYAGIGVGGYLRTEDEEYASPQRAAWASAILADFDYSPSCDSSNLTLYWQDDTFASGTAGSSNGCPSGYREVEVDGLRAFLYYDCGGGAQVLWSNAWVAYRRLVCVQTALSDSSW